MQACKPGGFGGFHQVRSASRKRQKNQFQDHRDISVSILCLRSVRHIDIPSISSHSTNQKSSRQSMTIPFINSHSVIQKPSHSVNNHLHFPSSVEVAPLTCPTPPPSTRSVTTLMQNIGVPCCSQAQATAAASMSFTLASAPSEEKRKRRKITAYDLRIVLPAQRCGEKDSRFYRFQIHVCS